MENPSKEFAGTPEKYETLHEEKCRLQVLAQAAIGKVMDFRCEDIPGLALKLGMPVSEVEETLAGEIDIDLDTMVEYGLALGVRWRFVPLDSKEAEPLWID